MPTTADTAKWLELKRQIEHLTPADQLRMAALCLEKGEDDIAETLARNIADELAGVRLLRVQLSRAR